MGGGRKGAWPVMRGRGLTWLLPLRSAGVEQLMYIKEDLIIPHVSAKPLSPPPSVTSSHPHDVTGIP